VNKVFKRRNDLAEGIFPGFELLTTAFHGLPVVSVILRRIIPMLTHGVRSPGQSWAGMTVITWYHGKIDDYQSNY